MSRLTVNEAGTSGYTDEIKLTPSDFTVAAGNETDKVKIPVKTGDVVEGAAVIISEAFSVSANLQIGTDPAANGGGATIAQGFISNMNVNTAATAVDTGTHLSRDLGETTERTRFVATGDGNIVIGTSAAVDGSTSGSIKVLLRIRRVNF